MCVPILVMGFIDWILGLDLDLGRSGAAWNLACRN